MEKNYKISLTGDLGSGKSTVGKMLTTKYNLEKVSIGSIQREMADKMNMNTYEFNKYMASHPEFDKILDTKLCEYENIEGNFLFDSRMAWHFASNVFKIFVTVDPMTAAERVMANPRPEEPYESVEDACTGLIERSRVEQARFLDMYGVDYYDFKNHNLVVDSTRRTPEEIVEIIWEAFLAYQEDPIANAHRECL